MFWWFFLFVALASVILWLGFGSLGCYILWGMNIDGIFSIFERTPDLLVAWLRNPLLPCHCHHFLLRLLCSPSSYYSACHHCKIGWMLGWIKMMRTWVGGSFQRTELESVPSADIKRWEGLNLGFTLNVDKF